MTATDPDRMAPLGMLPDLDYDSEGNPACVDRPVHRDYHTILIPAARLDWDGRQALRALLDECDNAVAASRLRELDLAACGIDPGRLRDGIAALGLGYPGEDTEDADHLKDIDWCAVGRRLTGEQSPGYVSVRALLALLMTDATPTEANHD
jgi:hypothetical protein